MRLNRRKNRGSGDRRGRTSARAGDAAPEKPAADRDERRRGLAKAVQSARAKDGRKTPERRERPKPRKRSRRTERPKLLRRLARRERKDRSEQRDALVRTARSVGADVVGVAREVLRWPARIWMAIAEALGSWILAAWKRALWPALLTVWRSLRAALRWGERTITPARGLAVAALAATIALGGSQFGDYRAVEVGAPEYAHVENVAPAPQVARAMPTSAHGIWVFAIAVASLFVLLFAVWRNWRLARLLLFAGLAVIAISLFVDRPDGLRLGTAGDAYSGAQAVLLGPFWVQLFSGATLVVVGPLLAMQLRSERAGRRGRAPRRHEDKPKPKRAPRLRPGVGT
jgi:hypothetical protein